MTIRSTGSPAAISAKPLVIASPAPQPRQTLFTESSWNLFNELFDVVEINATADPAEFDAVLPRAFAIVGQPDLPSDRLLNAPALRAICNVEGNFFPNVDYEMCFAYGIHVLGCGPAYALPVAEYALGLALDIGRGITSADRHFRAGAERYTLDGNVGAILLSGARVGLIGFGNLGRTLAKLLQPFRTDVRAYDPWLPAATLREAGVEPASLESILSDSTFIFVLAAITDENTHLLNADRLDLLRSDARLILVSRAAVADFEALYDRIENGRFVAAIDVWPNEPVPSNDRGRRLEGAVLSAHRAGGLTSAFFAIGDMVIDDLGLISRGLPPARMQSAARELVGRYRSMPVAK